MNRTEAPLSTTEESGNSHRDPPSATTPVPAVEVHDLWRRFGANQALAGVSLAVQPGEILALLGPNGAGKTTLLRILTGLVGPDRGSVSLMGTPVGRRTSRTTRRLFGFVPSGDRTFYLRISGLENLLFFARLYGMNRDDATERAWECLEAVDLVEAATTMVGVYSHGMQKRLSVARGLLTDPGILLVDEATHDLDPEGARRIQRLVREAVERGAAVIWTTQRVDEIRGFADRAVVLHQGEVRFDGSVPLLMAATVPRRYVVQVDGGHPAERLGRAGRALAGLAAVHGTSDDPRHCTVVLDARTELGQAVALLQAAGIRVQRCREERPELEQAFLHLTGGEG
jgi:ABC-2 type transport system ATP-binding protein